MEVDDVEVVGSVEGEVAELLRGVVFRVVAPLPVPVPEEHADSTSAALAARAAAMATR